ncbi:serine/threonine protein kinase [Halomonas vilamensis]|uniref:Stress response kinase A n=1 Tax=Vreelandella vilamensis TaxID=531309 RepID=A0ABU1H2Q0_9GAMM|nr:serine/threonine protein kinase [Halomonas vilamensis]MDR5898405.1 serine/threonine protein kinase [Halomonas vilamensis]
MPHPYHALSPNVVMSAIESIGFWPTSEPFALNSYENRVLMFRDDERRGWVVKFYRPARWSQATVQEEHDFLHELSDARVPVMAPWRDREGRSLHHYAGYDFALFPQCIGQAPELDNPAHLFALGGLLAKLHRVGERKAFTDRATLDMPAGIVQAREHVLSSDWLTTHQRRAYERVTTQLQEQTASYQAKKVATIRCHGDCHLGNILGRDEDFTLVDFDDCLMAPAIQDIWMLLAIDDPQTWRSQLSEISEGYEEERAFPHDQLDLIEPLRSYRLVRHSAWLVDRWNDPAFPQAFPWVAGNGYWDQHIRQLEQQRLQLASPKWLA